MILEFSPLQSIAKYFGLASEEFAQILVYAMVANFVLLTIYILYSIFSLICCCGKKRPATKTPTAGAKGPMSAKKVPMKGTPKTLDADDEEMSPNTSFSAFQTPFVRSKDN